MKAVIQRVKRASVTVGGEEISSIGAGYLVLLGIESGDDDRDLRVLSQKVAKLRIFADENGKMNRSVADACGEILLVSQFTLCAQTRHGNRPAFVTAMNPEAACAMYLDFGNRLAQSGIPVKYGQFGAMMDVELINDGPVTIILQSLGGVIAD